jgi:acyl-CoA synthetase (AMP-forming)/AMP-acid ligase II
MNDDSADLETVATLAAVGAGSAAIAAYLDARLLISNDLSFVSPASSGPMIRYLEDRVKKDRLLTYHVFEDQALGSNANTTFLIFEGKEWTYRQFYHVLQRVGNWLIKDLGIEKNEVVALDGGNTPEYIMLWLGLDAIGAVPALVNCNLTSKPLIHCVKTAESRYLISDQDISHLVAPCQSELEAMNVKCIFYSPSFLASLSDASPTPEERRKNLNPVSLRCLIYTSGTTGMPKATVMWTLRELSIGFGIARYLKLQPGKSRMYTCMPLYHGAAHGLCVTPSIHAGSTVVLSRKFSHKTFWPEVSTSNATIIQYVGELCRYLVNAPSHPLERKHVVEMAFGNGMRPDVWEAFRQRFNVPIINELYAATDGMGSTFNRNRGPFGVSAIGKRGLFWSLWNKDAEVRVKIDVVTEELYRDPTTGFAKKCKLGEAGEVFHKVDPAAPNAAFHGYYKNSKAGQKRFIRDVFKKGDIYFRSGDMQRQDIDGCVYFVDRLGDTFRWKSENVSTNEVSDVVGKYPQIAETNVYGVTVPYSDGRAGCAAIVLADGATAESIDWKMLAEYLIETLPRYAVPIFFRVLKSLDYTGTMKLQKGRYKEEGIDPEKIQTLGDKMYWLPMGKKEYVRFEKKDLDGLWSKELKL